MRWNLSLSDPDFAALGRALRACGLPRPGAPDEVSLDGSNFPVTPEWEVRLLDGPRSNVAYWRAGEEDARSALVARPDDSLFKVNRDVPLLHLSSTVAELAGLPFCLGASAPMHRAWNQAEFDYYLAPGFGNMHYNHGWMCAFKGAGHDHLVSRRWLEHGPWRLVRDEALDLSVVQFHDLEADAATALTQARPGHHLLGRTDDSGFIPDRLDRQHDLGGLYHADTHTYEIVVLGREVSHREMLEACHVRRFRRQDPDEPIEHVAYVFLEEAEARRHLHDLWLRGLHCLAIVRGDKVRLDADYAPSADKPAWVERAEAATEGPNACAVS